MAGTSLERQRDGVSGVEEYEDARELDAARIGG